MYLKTCKTWISDHIRAAEEEITTLSKRFTENIVKRVYFILFPPDSAEFFSAIKHDYF